MKRTTFLNRIVKPYTRIFSITIATAALILFVLLLHSSFQADELNNHMLINQPLVQLDNYLSDMDNLAQNAMTNEVLIKKFSDLRQQADPSNYYAINILDAIETSSVLRNITGVRSDIFRISAYNDYGDFISSGAVVNMPEVSQQLATDEVKAIMEEFASGSKEYLLLKPARDTWSTTFQADYLSLIRPIMNVYSRDVVGLVEIQKNKENLIGSVYLEQTGSNKINIYNENDEAVLLQADGDSYRVVASAVSNRFGWRIDLLEPQSLLWIKVAQLFFSVTFGCLVIIALVRYIVSRITRNIVLPLERLQHSVESVDVSNLTQVDTTDVDIEEVYSVANSFNTLMENVTILSEQEKKAYLFALQAQMNPHFLYNVLSIVNAAALEGNTDTVIDIVGNLSDMLRYSSSYENSVARLQEEVTHTEQYLRLMKARYAEMFTYKIELEDSIKDEIVPKLVIQPLFENCFQHGFSKIEPPYRITSVIKAEPKGWSVEVSDNGKGFSPAQRVSLLKKAEEVKLAELRGMQLGGLGVLSCIVRTRIITGKNVTLEITDLKPRGACLKLSIIDNDKQDN